LSNFPLLKIKANGATLFGSDIWKFQNQTLNGSPLKCWGGFPLILNKEGSMARTKSWAEKMAGAPAPHTSTLEKPFAGIAAGSHLFISSPLQIKALIDKIPYGQTLEFLSLRQQLAQAANATATCPASSGIFLRIVAEAAWDEIESGTPLNQVTPFWRIIAPNSPLAKKLRCGSQFIEKMRALEKENA
jgi:hypothetical protein